MKPFLCLIATVAIASLAPCISSAADPGDDASKGRTFLRPKCVCRMARLCALLLRPPCLGGDNVFPSYFYPGV